MDGIETVIRGEGEREERSSSDGRWRMRIRTIGNDNDMVEAC